MNLAPHAGIGDIAERRPIDISNKLPACARQNYDLVGSILRNPVEGIDKFRVSLRGHNERPAVAVELSNQHTLGISGQLQAPIGGEIIRLHRGYGSRSHVSILSSGRAIEISELPARSWR